MATKSINKRGLFLNIMLVLEALNILWSLKGFAVSSATLSTYLLGLTVILYALSLYWIIKWKKIGLFIALAAFVVGIIMNLINGRIYLDIFALLLIIAVWNEWGKFN